MCNLKVWSLCQKSGLSVHPWGRLSLSHSLTFLLYQRGCTVTKTDSEIPLPPVRLRAPLSKNQRPIFRTLSDKHDFLVDLSLFIRRLTGAQILLYLGSWQVCCGCRITNLKASDHASLLNWLGRKETSSYNQNTPEIPILNYLFSQLNEYQKLYKHVRTKIILLLWVILQPGTNIQVGAIWELNHITLYRRDKLLQTVLPLKPDERHLNACDKITSVEVSCFLKQSIFRWIIFSAGGSEDGVVRGTCWHRTGRKLSSMFLLCFLCTVFFFLNW